MMKFVILVICALLQFPCQSSAQDKVNSRHKQAWNDCAEGCSKDDIEKLFQNEKEPTDEKLRCLPKCVLTKLGFMGPSNKIDYDAIAKEVIDGVTPEQLSAIAEGCKQPDDSDGCKVALGFMKCAVVKLKNY